MSTLPIEAAFTSLVHLPDPAGGHGSLVYGTAIAVLGGEGVSLPVPLMLLAGREGQAGSADGRVTKARFGHSQGMTVETRGRIICADGSFF